MSEIEDRDKEFILLNAKAIGRIALNAMQKEASTIKDERILLYSLINAAEFINGAIKTRCKERLSILEQLK